MSDAVVPPVYFDFDGEEITVAEWSDLHADRERRTVERTQIGPDVVVITMWHGHDPEYWPDLSPGPALIYGTATFGRGGMLFETCTADRVGAVRAHGTHVAAANLFQRLGIDLANVLVERAASAS